MRIDHINAYLDGGAGVASRRLHRGLRAAGIDSHYWSVEGSPGGRYGHDAECFHALPWGTAAGARGSRGRHGWRWLKERLLRSYYRRGRPQRFGIYSGPIRPYDTRHDPRSMDGDVLHLHWVSRIIDYPSFFASLPPGLPVVWTFHDMQPFTGGCHHALDCSAFEEACGSCPILGRPGPRDLSFRDHGIKRQALGDRPIHVVTPSRWLELLARGSGVLGPKCTFRTIRNGIDPAAFFPVEKRAARAALGLPPEGLIVAYGAESLRNEPKGVREYLEALRQLAQIGGVIGLVFGKDSPPEVDPAVKLVNLGFLSDVSRQRLAYAAADVFALPSHAETISQTAVESLACRTPVVAFAVGGVPEVVRDGETGLLATPRDATDLAAKIRILWEHPELRARLAARGAELVREEFEVATQVAAHETLYRGLAQA